MGQLLLFSLLLGWLALAPILTEGLTALLLLTWPLLINKLLATVLLIGFLLVPFAGFAILVHSRRWNNLWPFALVLLMTSLYIIIAVTIDISNCR